MDGADDESDFAAIYGAASSLLSPRMARHLWAAALMLGYTYGDEEAWDMLKLDLPPIAQPVADPVWMERFVRCFDDIAARLAVQSGDSGHPFRLKADTRSG